MEQAVPSRPAAERVLNANYLKLWFGLLFWMLNMSAFNLLPYYLELRGASPDLYGSVAGSMGISNFFSLVLLGRWADRWSRKTTVSVYFLAALAGNLIAIWAMGQPSLYWYYVVRLLQGVFMGLGFPIVFSWTVEVTPAHSKQLALAWFGIGGIVANSLGPSLGELLLSLHVNPDDPHAYLSVWVMAVVCQFAAMACFWATEDVSPEPSEPGRGGLLVLMGRFESLLVLAVALSFGGMFGALMSFSKNYTAALGLGYVSVLLWAYSIGAVLSRVFMAMIMRRITERHMIPLGLLGIGGTFLLLGAAHGYGLLATAGFLYGLSHGILFPTLYVRFLNFQRPTETGRAATLFQGCFSIGWGLVPLAGGSLVRMTNFPSFFSLLAVLAGVGIFLHLLAEQAATRRLAATATP
ncbi:MAG TPA: MFS transporter [bacterium]|nr:MFS transporter [bacterium]